MNNKGQPGKDKLVEVYRIAGEAAAQVIKTKLESQGIPAILASQAAPSVYAFTLDGLGEYRILVPYALASEAREVIKGNDDV